MDFAEDLGYRLKLPHLGAPVLANECYLKPFTGNMPWVPGTPRLGRGGTHANSRNCAASRTPRPGCHGPRGCHRTCGRVAAVIYTR